jgi:ABC-type uncharacterized transport system involved in gliding motility auxiliary subunit
VPRTGSWNPTTSVTANRLLMAIGWLGTVAAALAVGRFAALDPRWDAYLIVAAAGGVACALIALAASRAGRTGRPLASVGRPPLPPLTVASAMALVVLVNVAAGIYKTRWDVTANHQYQLAPATTAALARLDAPVRIRVFAGRDQLPVYRDRLKEFSTASGLVGVELLDLDAEPALVRQYDVREPGTAVVEYKGRTELVKASSDQELTNALNRLREGRTRKVYFTTGHAERDTGSTERVGFSTIAASLQHENFVVETINLARDGDFPADATLAVIAGPRADFFRAEIESLQRYLERGGALLLMVDPFEDLKRYITETGVALFMMDPSSVSVTGELRNLVAFVRERGAELGNDVIVDNSQMGQYIGTDASVPVAASYPPHPITEALSSLSAYPMARSVTPADGATMTAAPVVQTSENSWSETDIQSLAAGRFSLAPDTGDRPGPVTIALAMSAPLPRPAAGGQARESRMVVVGDSDFVANYSGNIPGNAEMFLAMIRWLAQDAVIAVPPRVPEERLLMIDATQLRLLSWCALLLVPGLAVAIGGYVSRRPRGIS